MTTGDPYRAALAEILRRGQAIINGTRKALGVTLRSADVAEATWEPPEQRVRWRRAAR